MTEGQCPSCGAPIAFAPGSPPVQVCGHCQTVVARKGASLEASGKVGAIVDTDSPLQLHARGRYERVAFRVVGHLQKDHGRGPWDEWYLALDDGRFAWLAESEGARRVLFSLGSRDLPFDSMEPGTAFAIEGRAFKVEERGQATVVSAEGELPSDVSGTRAAHRYVDATGEGGVFASLERAGEDADFPEAFVGHEVTLESLAIDTSGLPPRVKRVALVDARCPQCNGPLPLRAPDRTRRVACEYCGALSDVAQGKLSFLQQLEKPAAPPVVPLGMTLALEGVTWTCIGALLRSCTVEGVRYPWDEFLLFDRSKGFSWLMLSNGHWVHLVPVNAGEVEQRGGGGVVHRGRAYKAFQSVQTVTERVVGELYWEVSVGERAHATEYVAPPYSLNEDRTDDEVTWTLGRYVPPEEVAGWKLEAVPRRTGTAPSQPNPHSAAVWTQVKWGALYGAVVVAVYAILAVGARETPVLAATFDVPAGVASGSPEAMRFTDPFEVSSKGALAVTLHAQPMSNDWLGVQGDLVDEATGVVRSFYLEASYYSGADSDGSWNEDNLTATQRLSDLEPGRYILRLTPSFATMGARGFRVQAVAGLGPRPSVLVAALIALFALPLLTALRRSSFETARWNESNLQSDDDGGDDE